MSWPLDVPPQLPPPGSRGDFGYKRSWYYHSGIDLYCPDRTEVRAVEDGLVMAAEPFTGEEAGTPYWHKTYAVMIHGQSGTLVYGEIMPEVGPFETVKAGQRLGYVIPALKQDKGSGTSMLHFERYNCLVYQTADWRHGEPAPSGLLNPRSLLEKIGSV